MSLQQELGHIKNHVNYPATRDQIVQACNNMSDVPSKDKDWVSKNLPNQTFGGPEDVMNALMEKA